MRALRVPSIDHVPRVDNGPSPDIMRRRDHHVMHPSFEYELLMSVYAGLGRDLG